MALPLVQTDLANEKLHRTTIATAVNELIKVRPPHDRTEAEVSAGVVPRDFHYPPGDVRRYGAVGDGSTDDSPAFTSALTAHAGRSIHVPTPASYYRLSSGVSVPDNTSIIGDNKETCQIRPGGNIDVFTLGAGAQLHHLYIEGNATTGRGVVIGSGDGNQTIQNCRIINFDCGTTQGVIHFTATDAGSRFSAHDLEVWQTNGASGNGKFAVLISDSGLASEATPHKFSQIETGGKCAFSFGGCNDLFISNSFLADLAFSSNSRAVQITGTRIANQTALTINGANHSIVGNDIAPQITVASGCTNTVIGPNSYNNLPFIDNQAFPASVSVTHYRQEYTPTLTTAGTAPSLGNGTLQGYYTRNGAILGVVINFTVGSTTTLGTGALQFSLPVAKLNGEVICGGSAIMNDSGTFYTAQTQIPGNVGYVEMIRDTSGSVTFNSPFTFGTDDTIRLSFFYHL